jgi:hypothetical protein
VIRLDMRLEHRGDRGADTLGFCEVAVDQAFMWVEDGEFPLREAPEEVRRAGRLLVEEGAEDHVPRLGARRRLR